MIRILIRMDWYVIFEYLLLFPRVIKTKFLRHGLKAVFAFFLSTTFSSLTNGQTADMVLNK